MLKKDPFSFVVKKKSQFQKHKEAEEEKKKRAEAEAARVYEEFVESFKGEEEGPKEPSNAFVRGGVVKPGLSTPQGGTPAGKKSSRYVPSFLPPPTARDATRPGDREQYSGGREAAGATSRAGEGEDAKPASKAAAEAKGKAGRGRKIDALMQKLIQQQEDRERRKQARMEGKLTAEDMVEPDEPGKGTGEGDPCSTNLYLGNLSPDVEEETLKREFGRFGPLGSVKIMWPRDEEQRRKGRNCGFVAFMKREDAEKAKVALNGTYLHDFEMRIGWGKAVPLPLAPIWPPQAGVAVPNAGDPSSRDRPRGRRHNEPPPWAAASAGDHHDEPRSVHQGVGPDTEVQVPADGKLRFVIDSMAVYVMEDGCEFEQVVMEREKDNADFAWLFKEDCPEHLYYRWRLYSLASEDSLKTWRLEPFVMVEGGSAWVPPAMMDTGGSLLTAAQKGGLPNAPTAGDAGKEVRGGAAELPDSEAARFEDMLRSLTAERALIGEAMLFALDNANAACDVADILAQSLTLAETPVPAKIARLFLVSDILHNTSIPVRNASQYRKLFEERLPDVFESFQECLRAAESRIAQEGIKKHILRVLRVWRQGFIFTDDFLDGLRATLLHMGAGDADSEEHAELRKGLEDLPSEDLDRKCRVNGLSTRGGRVAQISRLVQLQALSRKGSAEVSAAAAPPQPAAPASSAPAAPKEAPAAAAAGEAAEVAASKMPLSRWATVDEDEERAQQMVQGPISKWIAEQDRQQRAEALTQQADGWRQQTAAQLAAVAAAAVPPASGAAGPLAPDAGGGGGDAGGIFSDDDGKASASSSDEGTDLLGKRRRGGAFGDRGNATSATQPGNVREGAGGAEAVNPAEDHRRQQLRDIEVKVMVLRQELEESGLRKEEVDKQVQQLRQQLTAQLPGAAAEPHGSGADSKMDGSGDTYSGEGLAAASASKPKSSAAERERGRDREVEKETEKDSRARRSSRDRSWDRSRRSRSRERDRDRDSKRDSYRERDNDRRSRRNRSRSSSRDRGRDDRRRSRSRSRDRDRDDRRRSRSRSRSRDWGKRDRRRDSKSHRSR